MRPASEGKVLLDLNRSPVAGGAADSQNEDPLAVNSDQSPLAGGDASQADAPISPAPPVVVDLDLSLVVGGGGGSHNEIPTAVGTQDSPIDVEALDDEGIRRNGTGRRRRRHPVVVVDLEPDTDQQGFGDARTTPCRPSGSKRRRVLPVIRISPDRERRASNQRNSLAPVSRSTANVAPKEQVFTCPVCLNKLEQPSVTSCGHVYCTTCIKASVTAQKKCPVCRKKLGPRSFHRVYLPATTDQS